MNKRNKLLPLTETTFYVMTALRSPGHGYQVMQTIEEMSGGDVRIAAGTMYGALESLLKQNLIQALPSKDPRRKIYQTTPLGLEILDLDKKRMLKMINALETEMKVE